MKSLVLSALSFFVSVNAFAALPVPTHTVYTLMKCTSFNKKNGTLWASVGRKVSSDGESYFLTEIGYLPPANSDFSAALSWVDPVAPDMKIELSDTFIKIEFTANKGTRTQSHKIVAMGDSSDPGGFKGNWALTEDGQESDDLVTCSAR